MKAYFFPEEESIDIHETLDHNNSRGTLKKIRVIGWILLYIIYGW